MIFLKIEIKAPVTDSIVIKELLSPWDITFTKPNNNDADVTIFYNEELSPARNVLVIPSESNCFARFAKHPGLKIRQNNRDRVYVQATKSVKLGIVPCDLYCYNQSTPNSADDNNETDFLAKDNSLFLKLDLIKEYNSIMKGILSPEQSTFHKCVSKIPLPYSVAPKRLRNWVMKADKDQANLDFFNSLPMDAVRFALINAIEKLTRGIIKRKPLFSGKYTCILTHDVESTQGLKRALKLKKVEEKYDVHSAWYLPSNRYKIDKEAALELASNGEIGAHDTKHDGKLANVPKRKLVDRFTKARQTLGNITKQQIKGFRAPILQHNASILEALVEAGYSYDTSIPTWEPKHPYTMKPHGVGTVFPLTIKGITEIPLTITQDHQLFNVLGLNKDETLKIWGEMAAGIREIGGVAVFLVHPDYELADGNMELYEELVNSIKSDSIAKVTTPSVTCEMIKELATSEASMVDLEDYPLV